MCGVVEAGAVGAAAGGSLWIAAVSTVDAMVCICSTGLRVKGDCGRARGVVVEIRTRSVRACLEELQEVVNCE